MMFQKRQQFSKGKPKRKRPVPEITIDYLREQAYHYLARYSSSIERTRTVLRRKTRKAYNEHGGEWNDYEAKISQILDHVLDIGLIDEERFATLQAKAHHNQGFSKVKIKTKLYQSQFGRNAIEKALEGIAGESAEAEIQRACAYVRRRRLGPFREGPRDWKLKKRDYNALIRSGFSFGITGRVMSCKTIEDFELLELETSGFEDEPASFL
ncbi:MAG: RecX family transcriptional regulator [Planctomycetota bacterium]|nr:RecX family transcriptional regulator [Planctomycetota bacterium]